MSRTLFRTVTAAACAVAVLFASPVCAQRPHDQIRLRDHATFDPGATLTATLEHLLLGVPAISDRQRERIESLEAQLRDTVATRGTALIRIRRSIVVRSPWWDQETVAQDREVNAILATRARVIDELREELTEAQRKQFDRNVLAFRNWDHWYWLILVRTGHHALVPDPLWEWR